MGVGDGVAALETVTVAATESTEPPVFDTRTQYAVVVAGTTMRSGLPGTGVDVSPLAPAYH